MKALYAALVIALMLVPACALADSTTWTDGTAENTVTVDSGEVHYRQSKALDDKKSAWWEYKIALTDIDCVQFTQLSAGTVLTVVGKQSDAVIKRADPNGTGLGYEEALKHFEIDFPKERSATAKAILDEVTGSMPGLAARTNKGDCAGA